VLGKSGGDALVNGHAIGIDTAGEGMESPFTAALAPRQISTARRETAWDPGEDSRESMGNGIHHLRGLGG
jgi:hypothetical protein